MYLVETMFCLVSLIFHPLCNCNRLVHPSDSSWNYSNTDNKDYFPTLYIVWLQLVGRSWGSLMSACLWNETTGISILNGSSRSLFHLKFMSFWTATEPIKIRKILSTKSIIRRRYKRVGNYWVEYLGSFV